MKLMSNRILILTFGSSATYTAITANRAFTVQLPTATAEIGLPMQCNLLLFRRKPFSSGAVAMANYLRLPELQTLYT